MFSKFSFSKALLFSLSLFMSYSANAALTQVSFLITDYYTQGTTNPTKNKYYDVIGNEVDVNNDCSGYFGKFGDCKITHVLSGDDKVFATVMGKFDGEDNTKHEFVSPSQASDWNFTVNNINQANPGQNGTGDWHYTGTAYPGISFWVTKASNAFIVNWMINDTTENNVTCTTEFSIACMNLAVSVTTGAWTTPLTDSNDNSPIVPRDLSHITFYGNKKIDVPEPATLALFALALLGIAARRKSHS